MPRKVKSLVWKFFDQIENNGRCVSVLCKLCDTEYKFFGNTTNLKTHLTNKHPIQWNLMQNGSLDDSVLRYDEDSNAATPGKRDKNIDSTDNLDEDTNASVTLIRHMNEDGQEEWLEETFHTETVEAYEPKHKKFKSRKIKREIESPTPRRISRLPRNSVHYETDPFVIESPKDEYSVFGEYIANKLRKFKSDRTRGNLQQLITTILWQAEYGMYDEAESVKRVLVHSYQQDVNCSQIDDNVQSEQVVLTESPVNN